MKRDATAPPQAIGHGTTQDFEGRGPQPAPGCSPWQTASEKARPHITPLSSRDGNGRGSARHTAGGNGTERAHSRVQSRPARGRATTSASELTDPHPPSRAAVIGVTSHADKSPQGSPTPQGLTATAAHNRPPSAGQAQACHADTPAAVAVDASSLATARTTTKPPPTQASASPLPTYPQEGGQRGRRIAAPAVSHPARVGLRTRLTTPRVQLASAGPSAARTQGAALGGAKGKPEDAAARSVSAAARCARGVVRRVRKQSTRPDGFRPSSTRPAGLIPAGVTQGEEI